MIRNEEKLLNLLQKYSGESAINWDCDLEWDLGITGDDAFDMLVEYRDMFGVDVSEFQFEKYFFDEGHNIVLLFNRIFRNYKKQSFTVNDLLEGIEVGQLKC